MSKNKSSKKRKKAAKKKAAKLDKQILKASEAVLSVSVAAGKKWHSLFKQSITLTQPIQEKQIDMFYDTTEIVKDQVEKGAERFKEAFGIEEPVGKIVKKQLKKKKVEKVLKSNADKILAVRSVEDAKEVVEEGVVKLRMELADIISPKKSKKKKKNAAKKKSKKSTSKKEDKKKKAKSKETIDTPTITGKIKDDLKKIYGIGPKMESILNAQGIKTFNALNKMSADSLQKVIDSSGNAYKVYKAAQWLNQAALASKGEFKKLEEWIDDKFKK